MNKEEFLKTLRKRLNVLEDSEIEDIISEYEGYIEEKVNVGLSEEEAVKELGDINEIVSDLLAAYKVKEPQEEGVNGIINKFCNSIDNFMSSLDNKSAKDIIRILIEIIIILLAIWLLKIPFALIRDLGENIFYEVPNPVGNILGSIWWIVVEFSYIIVAIIFFFKMFEKRYFKNVSIRIVDEVEEDYKKEKDEKKNSDKKETKKRKINKVNETSENESSHNYETKKTNHVVVRNHTFVDTLTDICIVILKFFAIFFAIGTIFYLVGISIALGLAIYLICQGVTYFGFLILIVALFMGGALVLEFLISFLFNKPMKARHIFASLISCILVLAVGLTMSAIEIGNTEIIYESSYHNTKTVEKTIPITNDKIVLYYYDNILVDNTLNNEVRIEYVYPNLSDMDISIELDKCGEGYCLHSNVNRFKWNKKIMNYLVNTLKDKKIYVHDFELTKNIYVNEQDLSKIGRNNYYYSDSPSYTFTKTYNVLNITESNSEMYLYLTLRQFQCEEVETVRVSRSLASSIEAGKNYEFTFTSHNLELFGDIKEIFEECQLINIKLTDKEGLDQIQDI